MAEAIAGTNYVFSGDSMHRLLTGRETRESICILVSESAGTTGTPVHVHAREDETIQVLEGELQAIVECTVHSLRAGQALFLPAEYHTEFAT